MNPSARPSTRRSHAQLFLLFRLGEDRYALDVHEVVEVLPLRQLKQIPEAPAWVAGLFNYRGVPVPVLDLSVQAVGRPARARTSTRLVLVHYRPGQCLGLILEQATDTLRCAAEEFREYGLDNGEARYLGPVRQDANGLVQWIRVAELLPDALRERLFPAPSAEARGHD